MCIKNKNYMENWLFWGLNLGNLKQCMMIMLVLTSSSSAWTLCSLLHISSLINICNFYSFWATGMVLTSKWGRILQEIHCQCQIWLICPFAGKNPGVFHKRNYLLSVNTTDFEKTTIQAHSAMAILRNPMSALSAHKVNFEGNWCPIELQNHDTAWDCKHSMKVLRPFNFRVNRTLSEMPRQILTRRIY